MKAIVQQRYGSTEVLELQDVGQPEIAHDEVLVYVQATGVARGDWHVRPACRTRSASRGTGCGRPRPRARLGPGRGRGRRLHDVTRLQAGDVDVTLSSPSSPPPPDRPSAGTRGKATSATS